MTEQNKPLDRYLSPIDVWGMAFGCMVGWGVFAMPGNTFLPVAGPAGTLIAMMISATMLFSACGAKPAEEAAAPAEEAAPSGDKIKIAATTVPAFKPGKDMKEAVNVKKGKKK